MGCISLQARVEADSQAGGEAGACTSESTTSIEVTVTVACGALVGVGRGRGAKTCLGPGLPTTTELSIEIDELRVVMGRAGPPSDL